MEENQAHPIFRLFTSQVNVKGKKPFFSSVMSSFHAYCGAFDGDMVLSLSQADRNGGSVAGSVLVKSWGEMCLRSGWTPSALEPDKIPKCQATDGISIDCALGPSDKFFAKTLCDFTGGRGFLGGGWGKGSSAVALLSTLTLGSPDGVMFRWPLGRSGWVLRSSFVK